MAMRRAFLVLAAFVVLIAARQLSAGTAILSTAAPSTSGPPASSSSALVPMHTVKPHYPAYPLGRGIQGHVRVCITVKADGTASHARVKGVRFSSNTGMHPDFKSEQELTEEAIHTVLQWKFKPRQVNGKPVATPDVCETIVFILDSRD